MTKRLAPYGCGEHADIAAKVGKTKIPHSLASRMPSPEILAKVGQKEPTPIELAKRMPSPEIAAKVGITSIQSASGMRVIRRNAKH